MKRYILLLILFAGPALLAQCPTCCCWQYDPATTTFTSCGRQLTVGAGGILFATDGVGSIGTVTANRPSAAYITGAVYSPWFSAYLGSQISPIVNGNILLTNWTVLDFGCLQYGGVTNAYGALCRAGNGIAVRRADNTVGAVGDLTACAAGLEGGMSVVTDSNTAVWGAVVGAGGANRVLTYCNGTNWTVMGK
jgi:hypothetical protein